MHFGLNCGITVVDKKKQTYVRKCEGVLWMKAAIVITRIDIEQTEVILCENKEKAVEQMENLYLSEVKSYNYIDCYNTFFDRDMMYAQVCRGFETTEIRVTENIIIT